MVSVQDLTTPTFTYPRKVSSIQEVHQLIPNQHNVIQPNPSLRKAI